ncbi:MAG TPA: MXAN_5187 family protein [Polyangiales bacterium]|nr:MXAN_5187 family protein [Polyangiales bacterium]
MLLSRFWYIFLAVTAGAAAGAALLSQGIINARTTEQVSDQLRRDRLELDAILKLEARMRLDRIAFITVDNKLGASLKQAAGVNDEKTLAKLASDAKEALRGHVARVLEAAGGDTKGGDLAPDLVLAVDSAGRIIGQLGSLEANPPGRSVATYPFVARALRGYLRDDVVVYDRRVYRVAARPVLHGGEYVGAIVHGYKFDNAFVERMTEGLGGASVAFFYGTNTLASFTPANAPVLAEIAAPLPEALKDEHFLKGERTAPIELKSGGRAVYSLLVGGAALAGVGYVIARPMQLMASPLDLFENASQQDVQALPLPLLGGAVALLAILGLLSIYLERDRPNKALLGKIQEVSKGDRDRLIVTEWRGVYRKLADAVNQAIDKSVEKAAEMAPSSKKKANLDEILGPTPAASTEPYFGFADNAPAKPKAAAPAPAPAAPAPAPAPAAKPAPAPIAAAPQPPAAARAPEPPKPAALPQPAAPKPAAVPVPKVMPKLGAVPAPAPANTVVAAPEPAAAVVASTPAADGFDEATHFREVYAEYLTLRRECGENSDGLSYDKFENTLVKTRDQVLSKHPGKGVRFTVYVKEGKAALKAAPIKK